MYSEQCNFKNLKCFVSRIPSWVHAQCPNAATDSSHGIKKKSILYGKIYHYGQKHNSYIFLRCDCIILARYLKYVAVQYSKHIWLMLVLMIHINRVFCIWTVWIFYPQQPILTVHEPICRVELCIGLQLTIIFIND